MYLVSLVKGSEKLWAAKEMVVGIQNGFKADHSEGATVWILFHAFVNYKKVSTNGLRTWENKVTFFFLTWIHYWVLTFRNVLMLWTEKW